MVDAHLRGVLCVFLGSTLGVVLGTLFVPDPTGALAGGLGFVSAVVASALLYRSDWLGGR